MIFQVTNGEQVYLKLNSPNRQYSFCAAAMIRNHNSQIKIIKEEHYFPGHKLADDNYQFGFNWRSGTKH
ncbi:MAG: hypothetical protein AAGF83_20800 [Cyanobacteria bacterium P01_G01_bin.67]